MKIKEIKEDRIIFDNGNILEGIHEQDCCESVYADFENMQVMTKIASNYINSDELDFDEDLLKHIIKIPNVGFFIEDKNGIRLFVSCYNSQNGYYSSDLELCYTQSVVQYIKSYLDISDCEQDDIC